MISLLEAVCQIQKDTKENELLIRSGKVLVNDQVVFIPSQKIAENAKITIKQKSKWVSRGALKLLPFVEKNKVNFQNKVVLDIGSSTGGFTQVALERKAQKIYALDVGTNQLAYSLRIKPQIVVMEKTNLKEINSKMFQERIDIILVDVSFISLKRVFEVINQNIKNKTLKVIALIKPQFEAHSHQVGKGGLVSEKIHPEILQKVKQFAINNDFVLEKMEKSEIKGKKYKNQEYLALFSYKEEKWISKKDNK